MPHSGEDARPVALRCGALLSVAGVRLRGRDQLRCRVSILPVTRALQP